MGFLDLFKSNAEDDAKVQLPIDVKLLHPLDIFSDLFKSADFHVSAISENQIQINKRYNLERFDQGVIFSYDLDRCECQSMPDGSVRPLLNVPYFLHQDGDNIQSWELFYENYSNDLSSVFLPEIPNVMTIVGEEKAQQFYKTRFFYDVFFRVVHAHLQYEAWKPEKEIEVTATKPHSNLPKLEERLRMMLNDEQVSVKNAYFHDDNMFSNVAKWEFQTRRISHKISVKWYEVIEKGDKPESFGMRFFQTQNPGLEYLSITLDPSISFKTEVEVNAFRRHWPPKNLSADAGKYWLYRCEDKKLTLHTIAMYPNTTYAAKFSKFFALDELEPTKSTQINEWYQCMIENDDLAIKICLASQPYRYAYEVASSLCNF